MQIIIYQREKNVHDGLANHSPYYSQHLLIYHF